LFLLQIDVNWAEQQHFNVLLEVIRATGESEEERKPRKLTNSELLAVMVD